MIKKSRFLPLLALAALTALAVVAPVANADVVDSLEEGTGTVTVDKEKSPIPLPSIGIVLPGTIDHYGTYDWKYDSDTHVLTVSYKGACDEVERDNYSQTYHKDTFSDISFSKKALENVDTLVLSGFKAVSFGKNGSFSSLKNIVLPKEMQETPSLSNLTSLTTLSFEKESRLTKVATCSFMGCPLESVDFSNCTSLTSIGVKQGQSMSDGENGPFGDRNNQNSTLKKVVFPTGLKEIGYKAFSNCTGLEGIQLPDTLESIGKCAFEFCNSLSSIEIPASVKTIGANAFQYTSSLRTLILYGGVQFGDLDADGKISAVTQDNMGSPIGSDGYYVNSSETEIIVRDCLSASDVSSTLKQYIEYGRLTGSGYVRKCITYPLSVLGEYACAKLSLDNASSVASSIGNALASTEMSDAAKAVLKRDTADKLAAAEALAAINALDIKKAADEEILNKAKQAYEDLSEGAKSLISSDVQMAVDERIKAEQAKLEAIKNPPTPVTPGGGSGGSGGGAAPAPSPSQHEHAWDAGTVTVEPTCTTAGTRVYKCTVAGCTETKTEEIPALGHKFGEWVVTTPATTTSEGVETRTCSVCGATETRTIAKLDDGSGSGSGTSGDKVTVGSTVKVSGITYKVTAKGKVVIKAVSKSVKGKKTVTIPMTVKIDGKTYKVAGISGNVFKGSKTTTLVIKSKDLTKKGVKNSLKGSKVKTVKIAVSGKKSVNKSYVSKYKKFFTKANCGKSVNLKAA